MAEQDKPYVADLPTLEIEGYPDLRISAPGNGGGSRGGWGLTTGSRRGEGGSGRFTGPAIPGFKGVIIEEHVAQNENVDNQYAPRYSNLDETIQAQISDVRTRASSAATTSTQRVEAEYAGVIDFIAQMNHEYHQQSTLANAFWGTSPLYKPSFFLAHSAQEAVKRGQFDNFFQDYIKAYSAVHEARIIDRVLEASAAQLSVLANSLEPLEETASLGHANSIEVLEKRAERIRAEQQTHFHLLPIALQDEVIRRSPGAQELSSVDALKHYRSVLQTLIDHENASSPPYTYSNPKITSPLTRTDVEALSSLVEGQQSGIIGPRWKEYHLALLHRENARHLQSTLTAFTGLQHRAEQLNQQLAYLNSVETTRLLQEQQRRESERRAETQRRALVTYASSAGATALPFIAPMGSGSFSLSPAAYSSLQSAIRLAIPALRIAALASGPALLATIVVATIVINWPEGEVERQTAVSIPLADLSPPDGLDLAGAASSGDSVPLPYIPTILHDNQDTRLLITDTSASQTLGRTKVVTAAFDPQRQVYSVALESPQRILTWTPASAPRHRIPHKYHSPGTSFRGLDLRGCQPDSRSGSSRKLPGIRLERSGQNHHHLPGGLRNGADTGDVQGSAYGAWNSNRRRPAYRGCMAW